LDGKAQLEFYASEYAKAPHRAVALAHGERVFAQTCATCHGGNGLGKRATTRKRLPVPAPMGPRQLQQRRRHDPRAHGGNLLISTACYIETTRQTTTHVHIDIGGAVVTSSITNESADELNVAKGQSAYAVIKASDVMVGVD
jgi:molybdopterin-binding protein